MAPGVGIKAPVPRTRTGCLTCRKRKVKCDEQKPHCARCVRLQRICVWSEEVRAQQRALMSPSSHLELMAPISPVSMTNSPTFDFGSPTRLDFIYQYPSLDRQSVQYMHHFISFCCRFIAYPNDNEGNPFQEKLVPLASSSPALLHAMAAVSAGHLARTHSYHGAVAARHYTLALRALSETLSDPDVAKSDSSLGACLLLCVYEITHSDNYAWLHHLSGAKDIILYRGGPKSSEYLTRFFSLLDVSGSLSSGTAPLLEGNYWLDNSPKPIVLEGEEAPRPWPYYDPNDIVCARYHELMTFMAQLSRLSAESMATIGEDGLVADFTQMRVYKLHNDLMDWWNTCEVQLRDQDAFWRQHQRPRKLTVSETLEAEALSSAKSVMMGCIIYIQHILHPLRETLTDEIVQAVTFILDTARETPEGFGLEMGLHWGLFMAGTVLVNDLEAEQLIRHKLKADNSISIYHASRALDLLEVLWSRQHQFETKYDWREVQKQTGIQVYASNLSSLVADSLKKSGTDSEPY